MWNTASILKCLKPEIEVKSDNKINNCVPTTKSRCRTLNAAYSIHSLTISFFPSSSNQPPSRNLYPFLPHFLSPSLSNYASIIKTLSSIVYFRHHITGNHVVFIFSDRLPSLQIMLLGINAINAWGLILFFSVLLNIPLWFFHSRLIYILIVFSILLSWALLLLTLVNVLVHMCKRFSKLSAR